MILKKIFKGECDEEKIHEEFIKFSKGEFENRYLIEAKKQAKNWAIKTSAEFSNFLVKKCLIKSNEEKIPMKGAIISTLDLRDEVKFEIEKTKNFQGVRQLVINTEIEPQEILELMEKYPRIFFALSFSTQDCQLKIKAKPPKSGKPKTKSNDGEGPKADFCSLKTTDLDIVRDLFFDVDNLEQVKEIKINHTLKIEKLIYPKDLEGLKPEEIREKSKREGIIVRNINVDGEDMQRQAEFSG